jgi:flagellar protein FliO/FliZ
MMSHKSGSTGAVLLWAGFVDSAFAQTASTPMALAPTSPIASMMQGLVGLAIVVGLIYAVAWAIRKVGPRTRASGVVQVVGGASVGPREKVVVVRFGHQTLLLGVAPGQVSLLHASDAVDLEPVGTTERSAPRFIDRLRAVQGNA